MVGAEAAQACTDPVLKDLPARGEEKDLVRFELTGMTPGSEYLVKVNGRERKSGVADGDTVNRRFRMPTFGDDRRRVRVEVIVAHDDCENSPWKLEEKMTYKPAPEPQVPAQPDPAPTPQSTTPAPQSDPAPNPSPPPSAPSPPATPKLDATPSQPAIPKTPSAKPPIPTPTPPAVTEPPRDGKAWVTPIDPYQRADNEPFTVAKGLLSRTDQPSERANSTAALLGLVGILLLMAGGGAMAWNRFRRYDEERLTEIENPEGNLPTHLDPKAKDVSSDGAAVEPERKRRWLPLPVPAVGKRAAAKESAAKEREPAKESGQKRRWLPFPVALLRRRETQPAVRKRGAFRGMTDEQVAALSPEQHAEMKHKARRRNKRLAATGGKEKAPLPRFDPSAPGAVAVDPIRTGPQANAAEGDKSDAPQPKPERKRSRFKRGNKQIKRGNFAGFTEAEVAAMSDEEREAVKAKGIAERKAARQRRKKAVLPSFDPTGPAPEPAATDSGGAASGGPRRIADADREKGPGPAAPGPAPHKNGTPPAAKPPAAKPPASKQREPTPPPRPREAARPANGKPAAPRSYRDQVESELQRILSDSGLGADVDGILADAKKEAQRQGVPMDSDMMLKALGDDTNGSARLSDAARGELESRVRRIVAEERGEGRPSPGGGPTRS
jgi:hypothetical protein